MIYKKNIFFAIILFFAGLSGAQSFKIATPGFIGDQNDMCQRFNQAFEKQLAQLSNYEILNNDKLAERIKSQYLALNDPENFPNMIEIGKQVNADFIIAGKLIKIGDRLKIEGYLANVAEGKTVLDISDLIIGGPQLLFDRIPNIVSRINRLLPAAPTRYGTINIISDPVGALLIVNGKEVGKTPYTIKTVIPASYHLILSKTDYDSIAIDTSVSYNKIINLNCKLPYQFSVLKINSVPSGARVFINNEEKGKTPYQDLKFLPGEINCKLILPNYDTLVMDTTISKSKILDINAKLAYQLSDLSIETRPCVADVFLNGKKMGFTPFTGDKLMPGRYKMELKTSDWLTIADTIHLKRGDRKHLDFIFSEHSQTFIKNMEAAKKEKIRKIRKIFRISGGVIAATGATMFLVYLLKANSAYDEYNKSVVNADQAWENVQTMNKAMLTFIGIGCGGLGVMGITFFF